MVYMVNSNEVDEEVCALTLTLGHLINSNEVNEEVT
jgi:hypothetical protein